MIQFPADSRAPGNTAHKGLVDRGENRGPERGGGVPGACAAGGPAWTNASVRRPQLPGGLADERRGADRVSREKTGACARERERARNKARFKVVIDGFLIQ